MVFRHSEGSRLFGFLACWKGDSASVQEATNETRIEFGINVVPCPTLRFSPHPFYRPSVWTLN
jgi:hypothetical protein